MALGKPPRPDRSRLGSRRDAGTERARLRASRRSDGDDRLCGPARGDDDGAQPRGRCEHDRDVDAARPDRSEEHTSELQSLMRTSYDVFRVKKKTHKYKTNRY